MASRPTIGEFLRAKREAAQPSELGVVSFGARRVSGLRREELAGLAGVSTSYYTRIEQGHTSSASGDVLRSLARALQLDGDETAYLLALAQPPTTRRRRAVREVCSPDLLGLMNAMGSVAAAVAGRKMDILAWTPLGHAVLAPHYDFAAPSASPRPNWARMMFLDPHLRELFVDWETKAWDVVSYLRLQAGTYSDDAALGSLIGELCISSEEFDDRWAAQKVRDKVSNVCRMHHPTIGSLELINVPLRSPEAPDQLLGTFYALPGTPSETALHLLAMQVGGGSDAKAASARAWMPGARMSETLDPTAPTLPTG